MVIRKSRRRRRSSKRRKSPKKRVSRKKKSLKKPKKRVSKRRSNKKGGADPIVLYDAKDPLTKKEIETVEKNRLSNVLKNDDDKLPKLTGMDMTPKTNTGTTPRPVNEGFFMRLGRWVGVI